MRTLLLISLVALAIFGAHAQTAPPAFEVASIKLSPGALRRFTAAGSRLTLEGYTPPALIADAYSLKDYQLQFAGPTPWSNPELAYYDVIAKADGDASPTNIEFRQMLQALLASRFNLKFHREMREMPVYELVIGKNGPKLKESDPASVFRGNTAVNGRNQIDTLTHATIGVIINGFRGLDRPVIDQTGLRGFYDIKLEATPEFRINNNPQPGDISLFTAVQETLGLKLEPQKAPVEVFVIDSISKPTEN
jgi:uncharacterized protein (TIGR03435 family)